LILIDRPRRWPPKRGKWSHMVSDNLDDLHRFAAAIGVGFMYFSNKRGKNRPHYDVQEKHFDAARARGAILVESREIVRLLRGT